MKILKGYSKDVSTDNTMAKRQREKEQTTNITQQTKDRATRTLLKKSLKIPKGQSETYIEKEQTPQWPKEKVQKDKQRSTKHAYKTKDRVTRTPPKTRGELRCSGKVSSSCSTSGIRRVNLVTNPVISRE